MTRVLVTGGSGFIGKHLVAALVARERQVRVLDLRTPTCVLSGVQSIIGSVLDPGLVHEAMDSIDEVYHLAGLPGMWIPQKKNFHAVNFRGTEVVIAAARKRGIGRLLHCSTESILFRGSPSQSATSAGTLLPGDMPGPYTRSKMLADQLAMQAAASGFPVIVGCPTMPIGPDDHNLTPPTAMLRHFLGKRFQFYLDFPLNLVDVRDAAEGLILAMERGKAGQRYILGADSIPLKKVLRVMAEVSNRRSTLIPVPAPIAKGAAALMELVADRVTRRAPSGTVEGVRIALRAQGLSIEKAQRELGYSPRLVEPALREAIASLLGAGDGRYAQSGTGRVIPIDSMASGQISEYHPEYAE
jgi:dihydroflavonol-4-reductase